MSRLRAALDPAHAKFAAASVLALALFAATYLAFVGTDVGQAAENLAVRGAELRTDATRTASLDQLTQISIVTFALAIVAAIAVGALRRRPGLGLLAGAVMGSSVVLAEVLKALLPRPMLVDGAPWLLRNTFPSGSAAVAVAVAVGAVLVAPDRVRWLALVLGALYAAVIVDAIQIAGWHRLSDTLGSALLVIAMAAAAASFMARAGLAQPSTSGRIDRRIRYILTGLAAGLIVVGVLMLVLLIAFPILASPVGGRRAFLQASFPLVGAGLTILALVVFAWLIEPYSLGRSRQAAPDVTVLDLPGRSSSPDDQHRPDPQP